MLSLQTSPDKPDEGDKEYPWPKELPEEEEEQDGDADDDEGEDDE